MSYPELRSCSVGYYKLSGVAIIEKRLKCPPGGFYQDEIAGGVTERNGTGCKCCLKGRFVQPSDAPGKINSDCQVFFTGY